MALQFNATLSLTLKRYILSDPRQLAVMSLRGRTNVPPAPKTVVPSRGLILAEQIKDSSQFDL